MRVGGKRIAQGSGMVHFVPDDLDGGNAMYLDVFSCKPYDNQIVIDLVKQYFKAKSIRPSFLTRQA